MPEANRKTTIRKETQAEPGATLIECIFSGMALHKNYPIVQYLRGADCGRPPHSAERLGLSGSYLAIPFLRLSLRKE
jgi:hypothetical protein